MLHPVPCMHAKPHMCVHRAFPHPAPQPPTSAPPRSMRACQASHVRAQGIPSSCPESAHLCAATPAANEATYPVEELFHRHGVSLAVYGHVHDYEHFWPTFDRVAQPGHTGRGLHLNPGATVHVTTGQSRSDLLLMVVGSVLVSAPTRDKTRQEITSVPSQPGCSDLLLMIVGSVLMSVPTRDKTRQESTSVPASPAA